MGLLIMLRIKISPQATITIQNSIPKIIITLILVTFSYAIIGLLIDITYLIEALLISLLLDNNDISPNLISNIPETSSLIQGTFWTHLKLVWGATKGTINVGTGLLSALTAIIAGIIAWFSTGIGWLTAIAAILGLLIILIFALIQLIKFLFGCSKAYIILLIKIISAPLEIALGAFPNSKIGFGSWFIQTLAYASVFPICLLFLVILNIIINAVSFNQIWVPGTLQGLGVTSAVRPILAFAGLIILAKLPSLIPEAIFQIKPSPFGKALGEGSGFFAAPIKSIKSGASFTFGQYVTGLKGQNSLFGDIRSRFKKGPKKDAERMETEPTDKNLFEK